MTTNPRSFAFDAANKRLICELCVEWVSFDNLWVDENGDKWDICMKCGQNEAEGDF